MYRSPQSNYKTVNELVMKSSSARISSQSPRRQYDEPYDESYRENRKASRRESPNYYSSKSMVIDGRWKYRGHADDLLRVKAIGIENLVSICHDVMKTTLDGVNEGNKRKKKSPVTNQHWPLLELRHFEKLTKTEQNNLRRAKLFDLMTVVYEAASTDASISNLVRIWKEASVSKRVESRPLLSYERAFQHLIRKPDDHLLQIAVHASLVSTRTERDLQRLANILNIDRHEFDINYILQSTERFQGLLKFLRDKQIKQRLEGKTIDRTRLPYDRREPYGVYANVSGTNFRLVCKALDLSGILISPNTDFTSDLIWSDQLISLDLLSALKPYQKINHFPAMDQISHKNLFVENYDKISTFLPSEYNFIPKTWILPNEYKIWYDYASKNSKHYPISHIIRSIDPKIEHETIIYRDYKEIQPMENCIVQEYIQEPYLLDGYKFDIRIYVLITSCDPLRVFIFNNGFIRICSKKYVKPNPKQRLNPLAHLPNCPLSDDDFDVAHKTKHSLQYLYEILKRDQHNVKELQREIDNIIMKTIFIAAPYLFASYRSRRPGALPTSESVCFQLLGFDILLDKNLKPWLMNISREVNFDVDEQIEFDIKIKLLYDTFELLHFRSSDRKKSVDIEKLEAKRRLFTSIGKTSNDSMSESTEFKEKLIQRERNLQKNENHYSGGYRRLFPIYNDSQIQKSMDILTICFDKLHSNKNDLSWNNKYLTYDDMQKTLMRREENQSSHYTNDKQRIDSSNEIYSYTKGVSTQTPFNIDQSISLSSANDKTRKLNIFNSTGEVTRARRDSHGLPPGVSASRITEKKAYKKISISSDNIHQEERVPSPSNSKSQMVTQSLIIRENFKNQIANQTTIGDIRKDLQLSEKDINRLNQLILDEMNKIYIHCPNESEKETCRIYFQIIENWTEFKSDIGQFWLGTLDANGRESVIKIVWNNLQQIMKNLCIFDQLVQQIPLNRHLMKLERRLLSNHGNCFWDACQDRHNSWESLFVKSTNNLSTIELDCCYRFIDLCKQALFIVYRYATKNSIFRKDH